MSRATNPSVISSRDIAAMEHFSASCHSSSRLIADALNTLRKLRFLCESFVLDHQGLARASLAAYASAAHTRGPRERRCQEWESLYRAPLELR